MKSDEVSESKRKYHFGICKERNPHKILEFLIFIFDSYSLVPPGIYSTHVFPPFGIIPIDTVRTVKFIVNRYHTFYWFSFHASYKLFKFSIFFITPFVHISSGIISLHTTAFSTFKDGWPLVSKDSCLLILVADACSEACICWTHTYGLFCNYDFGRDLVIELDQQSEQGRHAQTLGHDDFCLHANYKFQGFCLNYFTHISWTNPWFSDIF